MCVCVCVHVPVSYLTSNNVNVFVLRFVLSRSTGRWGFAGIEMLKERGNSIVMSDFVARVNNAKTNDKSVKEFEKKV